MIVLKSDSEISELRDSCKLASSVLDMIAEHVRPGVSTQELNDICHAFILERGAIPAPLNYRGFPKSICTSVNNVICHGIPDSREVLKQGDIINVDITTILGGWHGDTSRTFFVGDVSAKARKLVEVARDCMMRGIDRVRPGARIGDIGAAIQQHAEAHGYSVVREFVGHGIGREFHEDPQIMHYGEFGKGSRLTEGMTFTIEPMINEGHWKSKIKKDGWTAVTIDGGLSAQFEHTIAICSDGTVEILTTSPD